jgi:hypothetical protein
MLCNTGTPENVCLEAEKELGACTGFPFIFVASTGHPGILENSPKLKVSGIPFVLQESAWK